MDQGECEGRMRVRIPVIELLLPLKTSFVEGMIEVEIIRTEVSGPETSTLLRMIMKSIPCFPFRPFFANELILFSKTINNLQLWA